MYLQQRVKVEINNTEALLPTVLEKNIKDAIPPQSLEALTKLSFDFETFRPGAVFLK